MMDLETIATWLDSFQPGEIREIGDLTLRSRPNGQFSIFKKGTRKISHNWPNDCPLREMIEAELVRLCESK
jgi:hypothetical protein